MLRWPNGASAYPSSDLRLSEALTPRILVTGATGFAGRNVLRALTRRGWAVRAVVHRRGREGVVAGEGVEIRYADVTDASAWKEPMQNVDAVVHLVAIIRERGDATFERVNHQGTAHVVSAAHEAGARAFVHMSVIGAADNPRFPYMRSKWMAEQAVIRSGVPYTILRGSLLFGEGDEFINTLAGVVKLFPLVPVAGNGLARFQPLHVQDLAECVALTLERAELRGKVVEIGGPAHLTYDQIITTIVRTYGLRRLTMHTPLPLMRGLVWMMEKTLPHPPATSHQLSMLALDNVAQLDTVERVFGFTPRPLEGNIEYIRQISFREALRISTGFMPRRIRDH